MGFETKLPIAAATTAIGKRTMAMKRTEGGVFSTLSAGSMV
jgi:hypothetical protein